MEIQDYKFYHSVPVQIRFNDIDSLGHVNNAIIQEYFDLGRIEYFKNVFQTVINWTKFAAVIASTKTDFIAPIFINDKLTLKSKVYRIGTKSLNVIQHIEDDKGNVRVTCDSVMVGFDNQSQTAIEVSQEWRDKINAVEQDCKF